MTDWRDDDTLRTALLEEIAAELPGDVQPGDITAEDFAEYGGITVHAAQYQLNKLTQEGKLTSVKVRIPGRRLAVRVWRKP